VPAVMQGKQQGRTWAKTMLQRVHAQT
jgi:hypothetical protein